MLERTPPRTPATTPGRSHFAAAACIVAAASGIARAQAEVPSYHVTPLGPLVEDAFPGVQFPSSDARGLNENGDLIGTADLNGSQMQAFVYTVEHGLTPLPPVPGFPSSVALDISDRDANGEMVIVGGGVPGVHIDIAIGVAALWRFSTVSGAVLETRVIGIPPGFDDSIAVAVNNNGTVVGYSSLIGPFTNWKYDVAIEELETFDFPARVADLNNVGQVCGHTYRGDLFGNFEDLVGLPGPGVDFPDWAIDDGAVSAIWSRINDLGWLVGRAGTGISDGAGHFLVAVIRFADPIGWTDMDPVSHLSLAGGLNDLGDFLVLQGGVYLEDMGQQYSISTLLAQEFQDVSVSWSNEINDHRQIAGSQAHALLLTPLAR